uniref:Uncharacterized protein n=1 Tax=Ciona savignyi TaxID=51511 RepID=H2YNB8_CIOSA
TKKRKIADEKRKFQVHWTDKYFVAEVFDSILCLICREKIAVCKEYNIKRHYDSKHESKYKRLTKEERKTKIKKLIKGIKLITECIIIAFNEYCPEKVNLVKETSLSHQTIGRRIDDLSEDIEGKLKERLSACVHYSKDIFEHVNLALENFNVDRTKINSITTDGAPALIGKNNGFIALFKQSVDHEILTYHCLIHQEQLCAQKLNMKHLMTDIVKVVNFIRSGLNHRQFKAYLEEVGSEYDVVYFSKVRWLSRAATLKRFKLLLPEIKQFMETKKQNVNFIENEEWLNDLAFLVDITEMLAHLNLHLQGKGQLCSSMFERISSFTRKLKLFIAQLKAGDIVHFRSLSERAQDCSVNYEKYAKLCEDLLQEFTDRFSDFKKIEIELKLFSDPFSFQCDEAPPNFQLELIELQSRESLKTYHREHTLPLFYKELHLCNEFNQLVKLSRKLMCMWGSTYCCEQVFSSMKNIKTAERNRLTDKHLANILRIKT